MLVTDIDGTLLDDGGRLSRSNREALGQLIERGVHVTLATGRTLAASRELAARIGIRLPLITCNGSQVVDPSGAVLMERRLAPETVDDVVDLAGRLGLCGFAYLTKGVVPVAGGERRADHLLAEDRARLLAPVTRPGPDAPWYAEGGGIKLLLLGEPAAADALERAAAAGRQPFSAVRSGPDCIEVMAPGVSKATGLRFLSSRLGLPLERVVAVGNAGNDLEMVRQAGVGVAVATAEPQLLALADYVAPPHWADGVAHTVHRYFPS
ncbi:MAG: HAD family phosphatase [Firmicutes bacterium]|nr:HAD family phosphatase [Bacillota bacterium]